MPSPLVPFLAPGETILWQIQPQPYVYILRGMTAIAYGATWAILGAFWYHGSGGIGENSAFEGWWRLVPLLSLPFILAGLSFFFFPIRLGARARRTWYVITDQRIFIAEFPRGKAPMLRVFSPEELGPPRARRRFDKLYDVILTSRAQEQILHLEPRLEDGFFGMTEVAPIFEALAVPMSKMSAPPEVTPPPASLS